MLPCFHASMLPFSHFPFSHFPFPISHFPFPISHSQFPIPNSQFPSPISVPNPRPRPRPSPLCVFLNFKFAPPKNLTILKVPPPSIFFLKPTKPHHMRWSEASVRPRVEANKNGGLQTCFWGLQPRKWCIKASALHFLAETSQAP